MAESVQTGVIETKIPARLDQLPWARWHWVVVLGLGLVWILDGLEVTIVGTLASRLTSEDSLGISESQAIWAGSIYVAGACTGALLFGWLTDRLGRKRMFMWTLALYLVATVLTATSQNYVMFAIFRFFAGMGIGGEYSAINSAIDELIPARLRGRIDLVINGSFWLGTALGAMLSLVFLDESIFAADVGWRVAFASGAVLGLAILIVRRTIPESPRWLFIHGREAEAEEIVKDIEEEVERETGATLEEPEQSIKVRQRESIGFGRIAEVAFKVYPRRTVLGLGLFIGQAFLYNAVFFSFGVFLTSFYGVNDADIGWYVLPFALSNFAGVIVLGHFFDSIGRRIMVTMTYVVSAIALAVTSYLFYHGHLTTGTQVLAFCVIFFFASAGASSAYLTVSETFPMETRAMAIAFFYAIGTGIGGITGPLVFGPLIESGKPIQVVHGWMTGAVLMLIGGIIAWFFAVNAERRSLEDIAKPLTAEDAEAEESGDAPRRAGPRPSPSPA